MFKFEYLIKNFLTLNVAFDFNFFRLRKINILKLTDVTIEQF